jgi:hypothetical protein
VNTEIGRRSAVVARIPRRRALGVLALFVALAAAHTWPLALAPGTFSRNDTADTVLHEWTLAWVAHQIVRDPLHLFDANIFYPERYTLAYSDPLIVQALMGAPLLWAGASPVLVYNLVLMAGFALTGWVTSLVVARWTANWPAGILSGSLVAFNAFSLTRLPQIQDQHLEFFPLVLVAVDRLLAVPGARRALGLACCYVLQALTGNYLLVFTAISIVVATAVRPREWLGSRAVFLPWAAFAGTVSIALLLPVLLPYYYINRDQGLSRSLAETATLSAEFTDYLAAGGHVHFETWSRRFFRGDALFPGLTALGLAGIALATRVAIKDARARMVLAIGIVGFVLSWGPATPLYRWLYSVFPLMAGIRGAVRFGQLLLVAIGILAGFGLAAITKRLHSRARIGLSVALLAAVNLESFRAPILYERYRGIPPVYEALEKIGDRAVLVWVPFPASAQFHFNASLMLVSTRSWHPMLNGYSGFKPAGYYRHAEALASFPDQTSIEYLQNVGVTHVLVDGRKMRAEQIDRLSHFHALRFWLTDGNLRIYLLAR